MKNLNKWFGVPESEVERLKKENYRNFNAKFSIELTLENAKEFFYDFECKLSYMEGRLEDFQKLNIPKDTIIAWTTSYYKEDIIKYESLNTEEKYRYIRKLVSIINQFTNPFCLEVTKKFMDLIDTPEFYQMDKKYIDPRDGDLFIFYMPKFKDKEESFPGGLIPKLVEMNELALASVLLERFVDMIIDHPEYYNNSGFHSRKSYFEIMTKFNEKYHLNFDSIIEKLKSKIDSL